MNKLTKLGVSALCGSLAAVSTANAGELAVSGGVDMSWISLQDQTTGNPIGIGSNISFTGSGELDNGWGVALGIALNNGAAYSNTNVTVTIPAMGSLRISQGVTGSGIDRMDDSTPNVWEEAYGTGLGTGINTVAGVSGSANIEYTPNMLPDGLTARLAWSPDAGGSGSADKASSGEDASVKGSGYDITLTATDAVHGMSGLTVYGGLSKIEQDNTATNMDGDNEEETIGVTYAMGGFTLGYQWSEEDNGLSAGAQQYENDAYGITFAVNDDLSIGYNNYESKQTNTTNVTTEASSIQVAYTMGGASIRLASAEVDNAKYQTAAMYDQEAVTLSVSLAF
jgi:outer membrane protein OmpU